MAGRILVVDDNSRDIEAARTILRQGGFEACIATSCKAALNFLKQKKFDAILVAIKIRPICGYEVIRRLKKKLGNSVPIIFVSIIPKTEVDLSRVDGFVQKPVTAKTLLGELESVLGNEDLLEDFVEKSKMSRAK